MGLAERLDRDGRESFDHIEGLSVLKNLVENNSYGYAERVRKEALAQEVVGMGAYRYRSIRCCRFVWRL